MQKIYQLFLLVFFLTETFSYANKKNKYSREKDYSKLYPAQEVPLKLDKLNWYLDRGFQYKGKAGIKVPGYSYNPQTEKIALLGLLSTQIKVEVSFIKRMKGIIYYGVSLPSGSSYLTYPGFQQKNLENKVVWVSGYHLRVEKKS